jgi:rod shape-determining protein MreD
VAYANHPQQEILRPVKNSFIVLSLAGALLLNLMPLGGFALALWPDFVVLTVLYWCINQPQRVGMSTAFGMGLLMDLGNANTFGQHALVYSVMAFGALAFHRRLGNFSRYEQAPQIGIILFSGQIVMLLTGLLSGSPFPGFSFFLASITGTLLWPYLSWVLRAPQKPRFNSDAR